MQRRYQRRTRSPKTSSKMKDDAMRVFRNNLRNEKEMGNEQERMRIVVDRATQSIAKGSDYGHEENRGEDHRGLR